MTESFEDAERLDLALVDLERSMGSVEGMEQTFRSELESVQGALKTASTDTGDLSRSLNRSLKGAIDDLIFDGAKLSDVLGNVGQSMARSTLNDALEPVQKTVSGALTSGLEGLFGSLFGFAKGGAFASGRVQPFAKGGVVDGPTLFPMRGGATGLMGEAGPEAILPLARGADGALGVRAGGGASPVQVVMNISTPDVQGFARSRNQISAQMSRAIARGQRNL